MRQDLPRPFDVRLMNATTALLLSLLALALLALGARWVMRSPAFEIAQITVTGNTQHNSVRSLHEAVAGRLTGNFFTLDLNAVRHAFQSAPWVRTAVVQRQFPNQLRVVLQEHIPVARWGDGSRLVDDRGEVFNAGGAAGAGLPQLLGPEGQGPLVLQAYQQLASLVQPMGTALERLELQPRGHWHAELAQGAQLELGQGGPPDLAGRLARFAGTVAEVAGRYRRDVRDIERADLRYETGYALRLRGVRTVQGD